MKNLVILLIVALSFSSCVSLRKYSDNPAHNKCIKKGVRYSNKCKKARKKKDNGAKYWKKRRDLFGL